MFFSYFSNFDFSDFRMTFAKKTIWHKKRRIFSLSFILGYLSIIGISKVDGELYNIVFQIFPFYLIM